jgi:Cof subfamily protein (haloacid dehalogenase superfamily)
MDLIFFDLDGTLLNKSSEITSYTAETLALLADKNIAYTVATGRTMLSAQHIIGEYEFALPHIYNNGVTIYRPKQNELTLDNLLDVSELNTIVEAVLKAGVAPFINTIDALKHQHNIYHGEARHQVEKDLITNYFAKTKASLLPIESLPENSKVTNISMIGEAKTIYKIWEYLNTFDSLVAYSGPALEGGQYSWMDVHHTLANKGTAVENLKAELGATNIICFGDSDNDLSMFALADESYAPDNANKAIKQSASAIIGHHHEDGVAHFLRERFSL